MESAPQNIRLVKRAYWLIKLRWIAIIGVGSATFFAHNIMGVSVEDVPLYCVAAALVLENIISLLLLKRIIRASFNNAPIKKIINFQITADLVALTILLHYSGGIENPIIIYFVFHMIIASILLSVRESYLQATLAVFLISLLAVLEYKGIMHHHCLKGFVTCNMPQGPQGIFYVLGHVFILATTLYLVVYMTSSISIQLRNQEEAYRQANIQLQQKDRIKDEYVLQLTHDIKGHLAAIQSCLSVLANGIAGPLSEQQADFVSRTHDRTKKLTKFVKALLRLTEMRLSDKFEMDFFSLRETVSSAIDAVKVKAEDKTMILIANVEPAADTAFGNQFSIEETITNLLLNSIKYTPAKGDVQVNVKDNDETILVEIADTGIGIPEDEFDNVFDEFFRASNARKVERDGTGLGLSIAKQTVERHGGKIWVDSQEGIGTKISFTLPKRHLGGIEQKSGSAHQESNRELKLNGNCEN
ncbi:MAG: HAMP domain-containing sensor histidine kinase [Planctomycetota bacterium]|nr:HAMP domain-containing sensor histidine kinase [Planctomycetota bacterium]